MEIIKSHMCKVYKYTEPGLFRKLFPECIEKTKKQVKQQY